MAIFSRKPGRHSHRAAAGGRTGEPTGTEAPARGYGPYDETEAPTGATLVDLGSLRIPAIEGIEVRVQADPDGAVSQVVLVHGTSALQLGVFAAPRSSGIWDDVRDEIRESLVGDGATASEQDGDYGTELVARLRTPEGPGGIRFIGVDGPRWLLRAVFQGPAALDPDREGPLRECLRGVVVHRGAQAAPVREPLPLRLPREIAEQAARQQGQPETPEPTG